MNNIFQEFIDASNELDELTADGYFGEEIKLLVNKRDSIQTGEYLFEILKSWYEDTNQFNKVRVKELILIFLNLYIESYKVGRQESIDIMTAFFMGTIENPEIECMSAYTELSILFTNVKHMIETIDSSKIADKKRFANAISNTYSKGVEFIGKTLTTCIVLKKITNKEPYNYYKIYNLTIFDKVEEFTKDKKSEHKDLISIINRNLRNSEAHLSLRFNTKDNEYLLKKKSNGKIKIDRIPADIMIKELYIGIGLYTQAFIYSGILFTLAHDNKELFIESVKNIFGNIK